MSQRKGVVGSDNYRAEQAARNRFARQMLDTLGINLRRDMVALGLDDEPGDGRRIDHETIAARASRQRRMERGEPCAAFVLEAYQCRLRIIRTRKHGLPA